MLRFEPSSARGLAIAANTATFVKKTPARLRSRSSTSSPSSMVADADFDRVPHITRYAPA